MQRTLGGISGEVYRVQDGFLELQLGFQKVSMPSSMDQGREFAEQLDRKTYEIITPDRHQRPRIQLDPDLVPAFHHAVTQRQRVVRVKGQMDPDTHRLIQRQNDKGVSFQLCYPLIDVRKNEVKGLIVVSKAEEEELDSDQVQVLRTIADLSGMAFAHWEILDVLRKERREIYDKFSTYVSPSVVKQIVDNPDCVKTKRQKISVIFVDLRGFTNLSEAQPPEVVVEILTEFFNNLTPLIFQYDGTLDKYIGDEIMALWGAPMANVLDARRAVLCAWEMQRAFRNVKIKYERQVGSPLDIGISINTGEAIIGSIGSRELKNYTAIGDAVNTSARLEGITGRGKIHITKSTYVEVMDMVGGKWMPPVRVQGKKEPLEYFDITAVDASRVGLPPPEPTALSKAQQPVRLAGSRDLARRVSIAAQDGGPTGRDGKVENP